MRLLTLVGLLPFIGSALTQSTSSKYTDSANGITFQAITNANILIGASFPTDAASTEFVGEIIAPVSVGWVGYALGGKMAGDILILSWSNGTGALTTARSATGHSPPTYYGGPIITQLPTSGTNATHWKSVFRCQKCTTWSGGSIAASSQSQALAYSATKPAQPTNANSTITKHSSVATWTLNVASARSADYGKWIGTP